jgi:hypothetical protein
MGELTSHLRRHAHTIRRTQRLDRSSSWWRLPSQRRTGGSYVVPVQSDCFERAEQHSRAGLDYGGGSKRRIPDRFVNIVVVRQDVVTTTVSRLARSLSVHAPASWPFARQRFVRKCSHNAARSSTFPVTKPLWPPVNPVSIPNVFEPRSSAGRDHIYNTARFVVTTQLVASPGSWRDGRRSGRRTPSVPEPHRRCQLPELLQALRSITLSLDL